MSSGFLRRSGWAKQDGRGKWTSVREIQRNSNALFKLGSPAVGEEIQQAVETKRTKGQGARVPPIHTGTSNAHVKTCLTESPLFGVYQTEVAKMLDSTKDFEEKEKQQKGLNLEGGRPQDDGKKMAQLEEYNPLLISSVVRRSVAVSSASWGLALMHSWHWLSRFKFPYAPKTRHGFRLHMATYPRKHETYVDWPTKGTCVLMNNDSVERFSFSGFNPGTAYFTVKSKYPTAGVEPSSDDASGLILPGRGQVKDREIWLEAMQAVTGILSCLYIHDRVVHLKTNSFTVVQVVNAVFPNMILEKFLKLDYNPKYFSSELPGAGIDDTDSFLTEEMDQKAFEAQEAKEAVERKAAEEEAAELEARRRKDRDEPPEVEFSDSREVDRAKPVQLGRAPKGPAKRRAKERARKEKKAMGGDGLVQAEVDKDLHMRWEFTDADFQNTWVVLPSTDDGAEAKEWTSARIKQVGQYLADHDAGVVYVDALWPKKDELQMAIEMARTVKNPRAGGATTAGNGVAATLLIGTACVVHAVPKLMDMIPTSIQSNLLSCIVPTSQKYNTQWKTLLRTKLRAEVRCVGVNVDATEIFANYPHLRFSEYIGNCFRYKKVERSIVEREFGYWMSACDNYISCGLPISQRSEALGLEAAAGNQSASNLVAQERIVDFYATQDMARLVPWLSARFLGL